MTRRNSACLLIASFCLAANLGCANVLFGQTKIVGSGVQGIAERDVEEFTRINVGSAIHTKVTVGDERKVIVTADDNIVPLMITEVKNKTLYLSLKSNSSIQTKSNMEVTITVPDLKALDASGASHSSVTGLSCDEFKLNASGAAKVTLAGAVDGMKIDASGAIKLDATSLIAEQVKVNASGAAKLKLFATGSVTGDASGAASVAIKGTPEQVTVGRSGAANVDVSYNSAE